MGIKNPIHEDGVYFLTLTTVDCLPDADRGGYLHSAYLQKNHY